MTIKIIDTCTLINIFDCIGDNLEPFLADYNTITTTEVITEYTRKIPRHIPDTVSIISLNNERSQLKDELEYLFPRLGEGERSVFASALTMAEIGEQIVILTDDIKAIKRFNEMILMPYFINRFPHADRIICGDTSSLIDRLIEKGKLPITEKNELLKKIGL